MRKILLIAIIILLNINGLAASAENKQLSVKSNIYNPINYRLFLDNKPQGFFTTYNAAYKAAQAEVKRKAVSSIKIYQQGTPLFVHKQFRRNRYNFLPWQIEVAPGTKALYFSTSWEGDAELALIAPNGKRLSQKDFGSRYANILSYDEHEGSDVLILNPPAGVWKVWVLGKFTSAKIELPQFNNLFSQKVNITAMHDTLTFTTYWENKFIEDFIPAKFFLVDPYGGLYLMQSFNKKIISELVGYNGLAMELRKPYKGTWQMLTLSTSPEINDVNFQIINNVKKIQGKILKTRYDSKNKKYLFYWHTNQNKNFPTVLFLSAISKLNGNVDNIIIPLIKNPQDVPAEMLPQNFTYKYYITSPFGKAEEGLLPGPPILK